MRTYKVTVKEAEKLVDYVIAAPTATHAVESVKAQTGATDALVWTVWQTVDMKGGN